MKKKIFLSVVAVLVIIQFFRPEKNVSAEVITKNDISHRYNIPKDVHDLFIKKCYDCHSNNTQYPWYNNIQPIAWWMANHVEEGKEELNFSEFNSYEERRANHKLHEIAEEVEEDEMPLKSYTIIHHDAVVTPEEKSALNSWIKSLGLPEEEHR